MSASRVRRPVSLDPLGIDLFVPRVIRPNSDRSGTEHGIWSARQPQDDRYGAMSWPPMELRRVESAAGRESLELGAGYPASQAFEELDEAPDTPVTGSPSSSKSKAAANLQRGSDRLVVAASASLIGELGFHVYGAKAMAKYPYRCIGHIITSDGIVIGTGTLVGPRHVLTAAHVVVGKSKLGFRPAPWASRWVFPDDAVYWNGALNADVAVTHCLIPGDYWPAQGGTVPESDFAFDHAVLILAKEPSLMELKARMFVLGAALWGMPQYGDGADSMKVGGGDDVLPQHAGRYGWLGVATFSKSMLGLPVLIAGGAQYFGSGQSLMGPPFIQNTDTSWLDEIAASFFPSSPDTFGAFAMAGMPGALGLRSGVKVTGVANTEYLPLFDEYEGVVLKINTPLSAGMSGGPVFSASGCPGNNKPQFPTVIGVNAAAAGKVSAGPGLVAMLKAASKVAPLG